LKRIQQIQRSDGVINQDWKIVQRNRNNDEHINRFRIYSLFVGNSSSDKDVYDDDNIYSECRYHAVSWMNLNM
jgi:hypothetical protein